MTENVPQKYAIRPHYNWIKWLFRHNDNIQTTSMDLRLNFNQTIDVSKTAFHVILWYCNYKHWRLSLATDGVLFVKGMVFVSPFSTLPLFILFCATSMFINCFQLLAKSYWLWCYLSENFRKYQSFYSIHNRSLYQCFYYIIIFKGFFAKVMVSYYCIPKLRPNV